MNEINDICLAQRQGPAQDIETVRRIVQVSALLLRMHALRLPGGGCSAMSLRTGHTEHVTVGWMHAVLVQEAGVLPMHAEPEEEW